MDYLDGGFFINRILKSKGFGNEQKIMAMRIGHLGIGPNWKGVFKECSWALSIHDGALSSLGPINTYLYGP